MNERYRMGSFNFYCGHASSFEVKSGEVCRDCNGVEIPKIGDFDYFIFRDKRFSLKELKIIKTDINPTRIFSCLNESYYYCDLNLGYISCKTLSAWCYKCECCELNFCHHCLPLIDKNCVYCVAYERKPR